MANLRVRNLNDPFDLNEGAQIAHPGARQQLENASNAGALQQQMVPRYDQMPEVVNAQAPYPHQQALQQQMAGGPGAAPLNTADLAEKGVINGRSTPQAMAYLDRAMLGMTGADPAIYEEALTASNRMQGRRPSA